MRHSAFPAVHGKVLVFYADKLYDQYAPLFTRQLVDLPDGVYLYSDAERRWLRKDLTPVLLVDVPKTLQLLQVLLT